MRRLFAEIIAVLAFWLALAALMVALDAQTPKYIVRINGEPAIVEGNHD